MNTSIEIRKTFIKYFQDRDHTLVRSSSLVPGGDQTLLFTNAGMVQFKDIFLGTDKRSYSRAVSSQKCMRVAGKHNDLEDVGRDDYHHTFFEMLGNWSFGDYYKKEAIDWAWELLTDVWKIDKNSIWVTCFQDEKGEIPNDEEAAECWRKQPGLNPKQILFFGRKENFWEMADIGPCGPSSEIHVDRGPDYCDKKNQPGHICKVNGGCSRFLELWNLVFIQYNRMSPTELKPLPLKHVDTGMGFERIVAVLQNVDSNYKTDLLLPLMDVVMEVSGHTIEERLANMTPYRVIADHGRAATFLIADGVVPGNIGRNYVCRMIIRRAIRFAHKLGQTEPFLNRVAEKVIDTYGDTYPELRKNAKAIYMNLLREEKRFRATLNIGLSHLDDLINEVKEKGKKELEGKVVFNLYATHGLPMEITRDIAQEKGLEVDEIGFQNAMKEHRLDSGQGNNFKQFEGESLRIYVDFLEKLIKTGKLPLNEVVYNPYKKNRIIQEIAGIIKEGIPVKSASKGEKVEIILPETNFYIEAGGQVSDTGNLHSIDNDWEIRVDDVRKPAAGLIIHFGEVLKGEVFVGERAVVEVDAARRQDIMRSHTATHLLQAELRKVLGKNVRQAGSLVAPDRLRFDFTYPEALTQDQLNTIEEGINKSILDNHELRIEHKPLNQAIEEGAMALFGEKYGEQVRTIKIGGEKILSYELCGGTHVNKTSEIGVFIITNEGSVASGIRRIEAITGRKAYELIKNRKSEIQQIIKIINSSEDSIIIKVSELVDRIERLEKNLDDIQRDVARVKYQGMEPLGLQISGKKKAFISTELFPRTSKGTVAELTDVYKNDNSTGAAVFGSIDPWTSLPTITVAITDDLVADFNLDAGELANQGGKVIGGGGGGKPTFAQAGGNDTSKIEEALQQVRKSIIEKLKK